MTELQQLQQEIREVCEKIKQGRLPDEAAVLNGAVRKLLSALEWPIMNTEVVWPEYPVNGRRVDLALCSPPRKPAVLIEVKQLGAVDSGERQLFEYAFHEGVPMVVLSDGQEWRFYLPTERGDYTERRVYLLDLLKRETQEAANRLHRTCTTLEWRAEMLWKQQGLTTKRFKPSEK